MGSTSKSIEYIIDNCFTDLQVLKTTDDYSAVTFNKYCTLYFIKFFNTLPEKSFLQTKHILDFNFNDLPRHGRVFNSLTDIPNDYKTYYNVYTSRVDIKMRFSGDIGVVTEKFYKEDSKPYTKVLSLNCYGNKDDRGQEILNESENCLMNCFKVLQDDLDECFETKLLYRSIDVNSQMSFVQLSFILYTIDKTKVLMK